MGATQPLTPKQALLVKALGTGKAKTITKAAEMAGMTRPHASGVLRKPTVAEALERLRMRQWDNARSLAVKAKDLASTSLDVDNGDSLVAVQKAVGAMNVAKSYMETFEEADSPEQQASERAAKRILLKRALVAGVLVAIRASKRGRSVEELRAWCGEYLRSLD